MIPDHLRIQPGQPELPPAQQAEARRFADGRIRGQLATSPVDAQKPTPCEPRGLGLVGPVGCGKTSLLVTAYKLVAPRLLEYPSVPASTIRFVSVLDLFDLWRSSFDEDRRTGEPRYG